jgi:hypothetical protein
MDLIIQTPNEKDALASVITKITSIFYSSAPFANIFTAFAWKKIANDA